MLIKSPIIGEMNLSEKLVVPARRAKTVASISGGVIWAKRTNVGRWLKHSFRLSVTSSVKIRKITSLMPK